jgi:hypothetical protein
MTANAQERSLRRALPQLGTGPQKCFVAPMNGASKTILIALAVVGAFVMGYDTGEQRALRRERSLHDWNGSVMQARDAAKRWAIKNREPVSVAMEHRYSRYMAFPDKNCIQLRLERFSAWLNR